MSNDKSWWIIYFAFAFGIPCMHAFIVANASGVSLDKPVNATYISGFITASGIFLGFLTAALINKSEVLTYQIVFTIYLDFLIFGGALIKIFSSAILGDPTVADLIFLLASLLADLTTAGMIIKRLM